MTRHCGALLPLPVTQRAVLAACLGLKTRAGPHFHRPATRTALLPSHRAPAAAAAARALGREDSCARAERETRCWRAMGRGGNAPVSRDSVSREASRRRGGSRCRVYKPPGRGRGRSGAGGRAGPGHRGRRGGRFCAHVPAAPTVHGSDGGAPQPGERAAARRGAVSSARGDRRP